ncbi:MAG: hypothetical protein ETSY2_05215 [Candidatus Entotheonella gemina]|uniref:S-adenosylmethionine:diacylglycerol 3-amino-3-carboxypropyl transferase n=1 Tax=Candidatus Entotheonella gemina TaxID=1429439 RepID=W4MDQ4_9BACT|nr:MAG: hypothetical protein ETSY2_05215 [Candidatus Entotheonella gemina]
MQAPLKSEIASDLDPEVIRYAQVWEDYTLLEQAFDIREDDRILSVGSAGCNVLALLRHRPRTIIALDMSIAQIALMELKFAGIKHLGYPEFLSLWGLSQRHHPLHLYQQLESFLSETSRDYWQRHHDAITSGLIHAGKLERFFQVMQRDHLAQVWSQEAIGRLLDAPSLEAQQEQFRQMATAEFEAVFTAYFSQSSIAENGRDPAQFRYVEHDGLGSHFLQRFRHTCARQWLRQNHYMEYLLTGTYRDLEAGPVFLRQARYHELKDLIDRIRIIHADFESYLPTLPPASLSYAALSDIFEYISPEASDRLFTQLADTIRPGGRIAYWNLLVPRRSPPSLRAQWHHLDELSERLIERDRAWFYQSFHVEERLA